MNFTGKGTRDDRTLLHYIPALVIATLIFALSRRPTLPGGIELPAGADFLAHAAVYALLGAALAWGHSKGFQEILTFRAAIALTAIASLYGITDEWHQSFTGRDASALDWIADTLGAAAALLACYLDQFRRALHYYEPLYDEPTWETRQRRKERRARKRQWK